MVGGPGLPSDLVIPNAAVKYILFQRTAYLLFPQTIFYRMLNKVSPWPIYNAVVAAEALVRREWVKDVYRKGMMEEYKAIKRWLPDRCSSILDIGCGVAFIDVLLHRHYTCDENIDFYLLDKSEITKNVFYHFEKEGAFYSSLEVAAGLLRENGIRDERIHRLEVTSDYQVNVPPGVDLAISLASWGFHYPISTYLERVYDILGEGGRLILDIRKRTGQEKELERKFSTVRTIHDTWKYFRVLAIK